MRLHAFAWGLVAGVALQPLFAVGGWAVWQLNTRSRKVA